MNTQQKLLMVAIFNLGILVTGFLLGRFVIGPFLAQKLLQG